MKTVHRTIMVCTLMMGSFAERAYPMEVISQNPPAVDISTGCEIPSEGYCDQPYVVTLADGIWLCTMTTGTGHEGQTGQHIGSCPGDNRAQVQWVQMDVVTAA